MKTKVLLIALSGLFSVLFTVEVIAQDKKKTENIYFYVDGMNCKNCKATIEKNIAFEKGVTDLSCDLSSKTVKVTYKPEKTTPEKLSEAFNKIKMPAQLLPPPAKE